MEKARLRSLLFFLESFSSSFQTLSKAEIFHCESIPYDLLHLYYGQANLHENVVSTYFKQYLLSKDPSVDLPPKVSPFPSSDGFSYVSYSPKRNYKAVLQSFPNPADKTKKRNTLEIYNKDSLFRSLNLDEYHENVLNNAMVGSPLTWSSNENRLIYLAELKTEKRFGFWDNYNALNETQLEQATQTLNYESDYGEKLGNITRIGIFVYDLKENSLNLVLMPFDKIFPTNPDFIDAEGKSLIFCGFLSHPVKLGILHCINRPAKIYLEKQPRFKLLFPKKEDKESKDGENELKDMNILTETYDTCIRPLVSPDKRKLAYYCCPLKPPHLSTLALHILDLETGKNECIIPIIKENIFLSRKSEEINQDLASFTGISGFYNVLDKIYWLSDSRHLVLQSVSGCETDIFLVDSETKALTKLTPSVPLRSSYWKILGIDPSKDLMICSYENMKMALYPKVAYLNNLKDLIESKTSISQMKAKCKWIFMDPNEGLNPLQKSLEQLFREKFTEKIFHQGNAEGLFWTLEDYSRFSDKYYEYFPSENKAEVPQSTHLKPLIVLVHGGPHGNLSDHSKLRMLNLLRGYSLLIPNFTGSCGYGQDHIEGLMTRIGEVDVEEIVGMIKQVIDQRLCDPEKIVIVGGSYGGYLSGIMATHPTYSSIFKGAVMRNPVLNIPFMHAISDIPEWGPAVGLAKKDWWHLTPEEVKTLYEQSPMSRKCQIPCLLLLGSKDRRVPYQGSLSFRNKTLIEGGDVETFVYESDHALEDNPKMEFDVYVKILNFISRVLKE